MYLPSLSPATKITDRVRARRVLSRESGVARRIATICKACLEVLADGDSESSAATGGLCGFGLPRQTQPGTRVTIGHTSSPPRSSGILSQDANYTPPLCFVSYIPFPTVQTPLYLSPTQSATSCPPAYRTTLLNILRTKAPPCSQSFI